MVIDSASRERIAPPVSGSADALSAIFSRNAQRAADADWYRVAHRQILSDARDARIDPNTYAGIVAALSPQQAWNTATGRFPNLDRARELVTTRDARTFGACVRKALAILDGADPLDVLNGPKTRAFYLNLIHPGATDAVTVDRWIARAAGLQRDSLTARQYEHVADAIRECARAADMSPDAYQAVVWAQVRREAGYAS